MWDYEPRRKPVIDELKRKAGTVTLSKLEQQEKEFSEFAVESSLVENTMRPEGATTNASWKSLSGAPKYKKWGVQGVPGGGSRGGVQGGSRGGVQGGSRGGTYALTPWIRWQSLLL